MDTNIGGRERLEPRMDTNGHEYWSQGRLRTTKTTKNTKNTNIEVRGLEPRMDTNIEVRGDLEPRMDTNIEVRGGGNHENHEKHEKHEYWSQGRLRTTNGHEWTRMDTDIEVRGG